MRHQQAPEEMLKTTGQALEEAVGVGFFAGCVGGLAHLTILPAAR